MFGYIRIYPDQLRIMDANAYHAIYCGLCHQIADYSQLARFFLSFDMVFFAMLSVYGNRSLAKQCVRRKCLKKTVCPDTVLDYWAAVSILLIYHKLSNDAKDGERFKRVFIVDLENAYTKAKGKYPVAEENISSALRIIDKLEGQEEANADKLLDTFGSMMKRLVEDVLPVENSSAMNHVFGQIAEIISKWLYAIDIYDDLDKDRKKKQYNPLLIQHMKNGEDLNCAKKSFWKQVESYVEELQRLCVFLPYEGFQDVIKNVLQEGVMQVTAEVYKRSLGL